MQQSGLGTIIVKKSSRFDEGLSTDWEPPRADKFKNPSTKGNKKIIKCKIKVCSFENNSPKIPFSKLSYP